MTRTLAKHSTCGTCHHRGFIIFKLGKFQRVILSYYWCSLMLPFLCFRRIHRIRETFYFNGCTLPGRFVWTSQFAVSAFWGTEFWPFSAIGFLNINSQSCNSEQSKKKLRRNCSLLEKRMHPLGDKRPQIQNQYPPKQTCYPTSSRGCLQRFLHNVNRWCASLNYSIVPIFNSQSAYALFTQNTCKKW